MRVPAALVAGACFGAVFALQPAVTDAPLASLAKRIHMLLGVASFSAELLAVLVASTSLVQLGMTHRAITHRQRTPHPYLNT